MKKFELLLKHIKDKKIPWKSHTVRSLSTLTGYSHDAAMLALRRLRGKKQTSDLSGTNGGPDFDYEDIKDLSDETIKLLLINALKKNPNSERLIRCAIDFKVKIQRGEGEGIEELDMDKLLEMGLFKLNEKK